MAAPAWSGVERRARPRDRSARQASACGRATPGVLRLQALREQGQVVDFSWQYADAAAARQLCCPPLGDGGEHPLEDLARRLIDQVVFERYRQVVDGGEAQVFVWPLRVLDLPLARIEPPDQVLHRVVRQGDGVTVTLINLSANRRRQAQRLGLAADAAAPQPPARFARQARR